MKITVDFGYKVMVFDQVRKVETRDDWATNSPMTVIVTTEKEEHFITTNEHFDITIEED